MLFFIKEEIPLETGLEFVFELFMGVHAFYGRMLKKSINSQVNAGNLEKVGNPLFCNYLIFNGSNLESFIEKYKSKNLDVVRAEDLVCFKNTCFYAGKGNNGRKITHLLNGKKEFNKEAEVRTENVKLNNICEIYPETCHHEALSIEFSIIKALGV